MALAAPARCLGGVSEALARLRETNYGTPNRPTDVVAHIDKSVDFDQVSTVGAALHAWVAHDLGL
jgi:hypothetical protein